MRIRVPGKPRPGLLVPDVAIGSDQSGRYVLVVNKDNVVEQRTVTIGQVDSGLRVIESGIKPDDWVIIDGIQRAIPSSKVEPDKQKVKISTAGG